MTTHNPHCDGARCRSATGPVRVLPLPGNGNLILCRACWQHEATWRRERNRELAPECAYDLPTWDSAEDYQAWT